MRLFNIGRVATKYVVLFGYMFFATIAHAESEHQTSEAISEDSHFRVSYQTQHDPIPLNQIHPWILNIVDMEGSAIENAIVTIDGGMPAHNHGLPTEPVAIELGDGDYLIEGIKFSMTGSWEMWFYIQTDTFTDKVKFELEM